MSKILLVEDDNNLREIYEARLQAEGFTISSARNGEEALVIAKKEQPDLIISDIMMPKISGFEMLDIIKNTPGLSDVKVIMLTALGQNDDQDRAGKLGADRYLVKSQVTLENIVNVARELLEKNSNNINEQLNSASTPNPNDLSKPIEPAYNTISLTDSSPVNNPTINDNNQPLNSNNEVIPPTTPSTTIDSPTNLSDSTTTDNNIITTVPVDNTSDTTTNDQSSDLPTTDQNNQQVIETPLNTDTTFNPSDHTITGIDLPDIQKSADEQNEIKNQINYFVTKPSQNNVVDTPSLSIDNTIPQTNPSIPDNTSLPIENNNFAIPNPDFNNPITATETPPPTTPSTTIDSPTNLSDSTTTDNNIITTVPVDNTSDTTTNDQSNDLPTTDQNNQQVIDQAVNTLNNQMSDNDNIDSISPPFSPPSLNPPTGSQRIINPISDNTPLVSSDTPSQTDAISSNATTTPQSSFNDPSTTDLNNIAL